MRSCRTRRGATKPIVAAILIVLAAAALVVSYTLFLKEPDKISPAMPGGGQGAPTPAAAPSK